MQRNLIVAALSVLTAGAALAQSTTTVYGRLNTTVERQNIGGVKSTDMLNNSSRIGFRGTEDLGGGLKAGFVIEHGFASDTGAAAATFWGRQSEVNLGGGFGMLRLGNFTSEAYFATADYISMHNHDTGTSSDALYAYLGRDANKIAYRTPDLGGLTAELAMSLKEAGPNNTYDFAVNYAAGALALGAGYQKDDTQNQFAVRVLYDMSPIVLGAYVQRDKNVFGAGNRTSFRGSAMYVMGANEFHLNIGRAGDVGNAANSSATQYTLGVNHNLSKRTKVYTYYTKVNNSAGSGYLTGTAGADYSSLALGVRHNF